MRLTTLIFLFLSLVPVGVAHAASIEKRSKGKSGFMTDINTRRSSLLSSAISYLEGSDMNPEFTKNFIKTGLPIRAVRDSASFAWDQSREMCGVKGEDGLTYQDHQNETDAIRHFLLSAYLSAKIGFPKASMLVTARENKKEIRPTGKMDQYNNVLGLEYGRVLHFKMKKGLSEATVRKNILEKARDLLQKGRFSVLASGGKFRTDKCTDQKKYPNELHEQLDSPAYFVVNGTIPDSCLKHNLHKRCKERETTRGYIFCLERKLLTSVDESIANINRVRKSLSDKRVLELRSAARTCVADVKKKKELMHKIFGASGKRSPLVRSKAQKGVVN